MTSLYNLYILKNSSKPIDGFKYNHPFDGHGYINCFRVNGQNVEYKGIRVKTDHYKLEKKLNAKIFRGLATNVKYNPFFINNFSNISLLYHDNTLQSMSEGGVPYDIDHIEGNTLGKNKSLNMFSTLPYIPISAHPKIDNNTVVNFACYIFGVSVFNTNGLIFNELFDSNYYFHDFYITDSSYIFYLNHIDLNIPDMYVKNKTILKSFEFRNKNKILIVNKETLERTYYELPPEFDKNTMHIPYVNETNDKIECYMCFLPENFDLGSDKIKYLDFKDTFLHKITVVKESGNVDVKKLTNIYGEMPIYINNIIFLINKHTLIKYDIIKEKYEFMDFGNENLEEPVAHDTNLYLVSHKKNETKFYIIDIDTFKILKVKKFDFETSYGFHGTHIIEK